MAVNDDIPRRLPASAGLQWVAGAFKLFRKNPLLLCVAFGFFMGALLGVDLIPLIGPAFTEILTPLMVAGFMAAFRALDQDGEIELPSFLAGVTTRPIPLAMVGALYLAALLLIGKAMQMLGLDMKALGVAANHGDVETMMSLLQQGATAVLVGLILLTPVLMATWMAPPLVLFGNAAPVQALDISLRACLRNLLPLAVYCLVLLPMLLAAGMIPMLLGVLVAGPILMGSLYVAYQDIFAVEGTPVIHKENAE
jgi:hypothetical protein